MQMTFPKTSSNHCYLILNSFFTGTVIARYYFRIFVSFGIVGNMLSFLVSNMFEDNIV